MRQNFDIFDFSLSDGDMAAIAMLDTGRSLFFDHHDAVDGGRTAICLVGAAAHFYRMPGIIVGIAFEQHRAQIEYTADYALFSSNEYQTQMYIISNSRWTGGWCGWRDAGLFYSHGFMLESEPLFCVS